MYAAMVALYAGRRLSLSHSLYVSIHLRVASLFRSLACSEMLQLEHGHVEQIWAVVIVSFVMHADLRRWHDEKSVFETEDSALCVLRRT